MKKLRKWICRVCHPQGYIGMKAFPINTKQPACAFCGNEMAPYVK